MNGNIPLTGEERNFITNYNHLPLDNDIKFTSIILLTYNQLPYTKLCIESIRKFTPKGTYEIIVVDNNSTDHTVKWLKKQKDLNVIYNKSNNGFPGGCNQGIKIAKGENILLLNNDTIVTPNWLNNLNTALYSNTKIGVVGAVSNSCSNLQQIEVNYNNLDEMFTFASDYNISNPNLWDYRIKLIGFCYMIKKSVLDEVGLLDEIFNPGNYEDDDLSFRILKQGYQLLLCKDTFIHHFGSVSFSNEGEKFSEVFFVNKEKICSKWGFNVDYSMDFKFEFLNLIDNKLDDNINVLDIGCGCSTFLLEVKNKFRNSNIYGIEKCEIKSSLGKSVANVITGDIENINLTYENQFFDYIFISNILELLINPWDFLKNIKKYLKNTGKLIIKVQNIMHIDFLKTILSGKFPYDSDLFIKDQLRFFTLAEIQNIILNSQFNTISISGIGSNLDSSSINLINTLISFSHQDFSQQYKIHDYIITCTPN